MITNAFFAVCALRVGIVNDDTFSFVKDFLIVDLTFSFVKEFLIVDFYIYCVSNEAPLFGRNP